MLVHIYRTSAMKWAVCRCPSPGLETAPSGVSAVGSAKSLKNAKRLRPAFFVLQGLGNRQRWQKRFKKI
jgi:hypothetical protein